MRGRRRRLDGISVKAVVERTLAVFGVLAFLAALVAGGNGLDVQRISWLAGRAVLITAPLSIGSILLGAVPFVAVTIVGGLVLRKKVSRNFAVRGYWFSIALGAAATVGISLYGAQRGIAGLDHWFDFDTTSGRERVSGIVFGFLWLLSVIALTSRSQFMTMVRRAAQGQHPVTLKERRKSPGPLTRMARRRSPTRRAGAAVVSRGRRLEPVDRMGVRWRPSTFSTDRPRPETSR